MMWQLPQAHKYGNYVSNDMQWNGCPPAAILKIKLDIDAKPSQNKPGPRLNIKTVLSTYGDFHVKDKTAVRTSYL